MGSTNCMTGVGGNIANTLTECVDLLQDTSIVFRHALGSSPQDMSRAGRVSGDAMRYLDHIVNEILRARDLSKADGNFDGSELKSLLRTNVALAAHPVTRQQQVELSNKGIGNGSLPATGSAINMEKLLNKIKHRRPADSNFRFGSQGEHFYYIAVDKTRQQPDSIVEINIDIFVELSKRIANLLHTETDSATQS